MAKREPLIRNISDTARWVAMYRAIENDRPDAIFRDPYARRLAGDRGAEIAKGMGMRGKNDWPFIARTVVFDQFITDQIALGADVVVNLAAGLDARPYRMTLPASLQWIEIDLPEITDYKEGMLANDTPVCRLDRIRLDLADEKARRQIFDDIATRGRRVLVISEGLVVYLTADQVASLARDLARPASFRNWVVEIASPALLRMLQRQMGKTLQAANAPMQFGPAEGPDFFIPHGWRPIDVRSMLGVAKQLGRLPLFLRLMGPLADPKKLPARGPWSGACLLERN